ncbi:MAG: substrate-binding domain-containing protein [Burkholderiales bacterium]|nr:substrate-binding domain-containing protein [Burkholderiales bacterium]
MTSRRYALIRLTTAAVLAGPAFALAAQRQSLGDPLRLAVDDALFDSGLAASLQRAFGRDTGVAVQLLHGPASGVLEALERGEHDAALTNSPTVEESLDKQGLVHDRHAIARSDFLIVGPKILAKPLAAGGDAALALSRLSQAQVPFITRADGSGTHLAELSMWRAARIAPVAPWYLNADKDSPLLTQAAQHNACAFVERGVWLASGSGMVGKGYGILAEGDPRLGVDVHVMRTFRAERQHPAGKLFVAWLTGPKGQRVAASHRGYRAAFKN